MIEKDWRPNPYIDNLPEVKPPVIASTDEPEDFELEDVEGYTRAEYILVALFASIMLLIAVVVGLAVYGHPAPVVSN